MLKSLNTVLVNLAIALGAIQGAMAGVSTSGGGYAVVCRNMQGAVERIELLDLFEARKIHGLTLIKSTGSMDEDLLNSVRNTYNLQAGQPGIADANKWILDQNRRRFESMIVWVSSPAQLPKANDLGSVDKVIKLLAGTSCKLEQIAWMDDKITKLYVLRELWDKMDPLNRAALMKHEQAYYHSRRYVLLPETTSESIRLFVGLIFASNKMFGAKYGIPAGTQPRGILHDLNANKTGRQDTTFYYPFVVTRRSDGVNVTRYQFTYLGGRVILTQTYVDIPTKGQLMQAFPIKSYELRGWYAVIYPDPASVNGGVKIRIFNDKKLAVLDLN